MSFKEKLKYYDQKIKTAETEKERQIYQDSKDMFIVLYLRLNQYKTIEELRGY